VTFSRDPSLNGWNWIGNSTSQGTSTFGGWATGGGISPVSSPTASFDVFSSRFTLGATDTIASPANGTARGDCFLVSGSSAVSGCQAVQTNSGGNSTTGSWRTGDNIVGFGIKWLNGVKGQISAAISQTIFNFDPSGNETWQYGTLNTATPSSLVSFSSNSSDGAFSVNLLTDSTSNTAIGAGGSLGATSNPYYSYRINPNTSITCTPNGISPAVAGAIYYAYGSGCTQTGTTIPTTGLAGVISITDVNRSTVSSASSGFAPDGTLPVRSFYNDDNGDTAGGGYDYYTMFINQSLQNSVGGSFGFVLIANIFFLKYHRI
jgi:hypothetical protein